MSLSTIIGNTHIVGRLSAVTMLVPNGTITNASVAASAGIEAGKLQHQHQPIYKQASLTTAAAAREVVHVVHGATGSIVAIAASAVVKMTAAGGDDKAVTIDLKKNGSSILTSVITLDKTTLTANYLQVDGTLSSATLARDDVLELVVTVSGSTGTQATGVFVKLVINEDAA